MERTELPIAVFDSGLGGISVLRALVQRLPGEDFLYFGDSANAPYGVRPVAELYNEIKDAFPHVCKLGDSVKPGFIVHATTAAYEAAASLPTKPYEVKEIYFAAEKEAVKPQLINPYA